MFKRSINTPLKWILTCILVMGLIIGFSVGVMFYHDDITDSDDSDVQRLK